MIRFWTQKLPSSSLIDSASESDDDDSDDERALPDILEQLQFSSFDADVVFIWWFTTIWVVFAKFLFPKQGS